MDDNMILELFKSPLRDNPPGNELRFKPEPPFDHYLQGRMYIDKSCNRRRVLLSRNIFIKNEKTHIPYSRYIYQLHYWNQNHLLIPKNMEVDHIDNDKTNDSLNNYQLLTHQENVQKLTAVRGHLWYIVTCAICGKLVRRHPKLINTLVKPISCSLQCAGITDNLHIKDPILSWLKHHQILYVIRDHDFQYEYYHHDHYPKCIIENIDCDMNQVINPYIQKYVRESFENPLNRYGGIETLRYHLPLSMQDLYKDCFTSPNELKEQRKKILLNCLHNGMNYLEIGKELSLHPARTQQLMKEFNIPRPVEFKTSKKLDLIRKFYSEGIRNIKTMSELLEVSCDGLRATFREYFPEVKIVNNEIQSLAVLNSYLGFMD